MSDLISRQAALDAIQQRANKFDSVYSAFWEGLIIAQDIVSKIPSAYPEQRWIPVTEAIPEEGKWVLVTTNKGNMRVTYLTDVNYWVYIGSEGVTAWMLLPEPWRSEE